MDSKRSTVLVTEDIPSDFETTVEHVALRVPTELFIHCGYDMISVKVEYQKNQSSPPNWWETAPLKVPRNVGCCTKDWLDKHGLVSQLPALCSHVGESWSICQMK